MDDTSPEIKKRMATMMAKKTPLERMQMASSMHETGMKLMRLGILDENPNLTEAQIRGHMFKRLYQNDFAPEEFKNIAAGLPNLELE